jgi:hypothetical protein
MWTHKQWFLWQIFYTQQEYRGIRSMVKWCALAGGLCAVVVLVFSWERKHRLVRVLCWSITVLNLVVFIFLLVDDHVSQTCADTAHFYVRQPLCVFQAFISVSVMDFVVVVAMGISVELWASVVLKV